MLTKLSRSKFLRRGVGRPFLLSSYWLWTRLSPSLRNTRLIRSYGVLLHSLVRLQSPRTQYHGTFFFRNRPELELLRTLTHQPGRGSTLKITVLACSNGAEVYSMLWAIRRSRPDLQVVVTAIDISNEILAIAKGGTYSREIDRLVGSAIFERLTPSEIQEMFDQDGEALRIKSWLQEGITWQLADANDDQLPARFGHQDVVVANRFLCHMKPRDAETCLRNLARLVKPGGYLFVSGIDLDVRTRVARELGWTPVRDLLEEIHEGDPSLRRDWPWRYWGLEPISKKRDDWRLRYASVFQLTQTA